MVNSAGHADLDDSLEIATMKRVDLHPRKVGRRLYKANLRASRGDESYAVVIVSGEKE